MTIHIMGADNCYQYVTGPRSLHTPLPAPKAVPTARELCIMVWWLCVTSYRAKGLGGQRSGLGLIKCFYHLPWGPSTGHADLPLRSTTQREFPLPSPATGSLKL